MAPAKVTDKAVAKQLADVVRQIYNSPNRDQLTVNYARQTAEDELGLEDGFLKEGGWKAKSKQIIVDTLSELEAADTEPSQQAAPTPKKAKAAPEQRGGEKKSPKTAPTPSDAESEISEVEDAPERPVKKRKMAKGPNKKSKVVSDDEENVSDGSEGQIDHGSPKPAAKRQTKKPTDTESELSDAPESTASKDDTSKPVDDDESELSEVIDEPPTRKQKPKTKAAPKSEPTPPATKANDSNPAEDDSSSELSSVIDEPPPPKRKRKSAKDTATSKPTTGRATKSSTTATADSPDEAQIKLLQSQLSKCGVRKVWAFEFKRSGADTPKAKIKQLKEMLVEVGMTGRFSEGKAKEIKEMRELQADLQDVMQGEKSWGVGGRGRRATRRAVAPATTGKGRGKQEVDSEGSGEEEEAEAGGEQSEESDEEAGKHAVRGKGPARRRADLAFLGDESESE
ncbi:hypothetical protein C8A00DRAFT_16004 [Chaetomidium leptoderma]|uniref:Transcriptional regulator n=1 Tax=Chaetomidium leptoderma TaxID=669021 RepID=A0AAN6ZWI1_9PEZI|nr:hypothetical protein C8A00DRAFT_16004 [Chaetomidium leptoderma]